MSPFPYTILLHYMFTFCHYTSGIYAKGYLAFIGVRSFICMSVCLSMHPSICLNVHLSVRELTFALKFCVKVMRSDIFQILSWIGFLFSMVIDNGLYL